MDAKSELTLNRLLGRLEHTLLSPAADARLRTSQYERNRVSANVEHARTLLLTLEKQSATVRVQVQRQQAQVELGKKREVIKRLNARIQELNQLGDAKQESSDDDDEDEAPGSIAGARNTFAPARMDTEAGIEVGEEQERTTQEHQHQQQQEIRARRPLQASDNPTAATTTAREDLFAGRKQHPDFETTDALMSHNANEQEALSGGLLGLARALKESTLTFASSLEAEKDILKHTEGGLDKSALNMEQAERKMGMLRRMSEGQGLLGRLKLYAFIAGLWLVCFLLVFLGPKLRF